MNFAEFRPLTRAAGMRLRAAAFAAPGPARFWRSYAFLQADSANIIGEVDGCLVVLRRKVLHGHPAVYLPFPPLGPVSAARGVLGRFRALGIGTKMTAFDAAFFGVDVVAQKDNIEFTYQGGQGILNNRAGRDLRYGLNLLKRLRKEGRLELISTNDITPHLNECIECVKSWYAQRKAARSSINIVRDWSGMSGRHAHLILAGRKVVALSLTETLGAENAAFVVCVRDYSEPLSTGMMGALHALDCLRWEDYTITAGSSVGVKGMDQYKRSLGQSEQVQIYDTVLPRKLTLDDYRRLFVVQYDEPEGLLA